MNKMELIDRAALLEMLPQICDALNGCSAPYNFDEHCVGCEVYMLHKMLTDMPTIDAAPVRRGEWVAVGDDDQDEGMFFCSRCKDERWFGEEVYTSAEAARLCHYCPNCGADMRGVSE